MSSGRALSKPEDDLKRRPSQAAERLNALREQVSFAQHVSEYVRNNQEQVLREFHEGFRKRLKPLEILLGTGGLAEILSSLADINELRPQLYPVYRSTMEEAAVKDIRQVFGNEGASLLGKAAVSRLVTAWEYWKKQQNSAGDSLRDFLDTRKVDNYNHTGIWEVGDIIGESPISPYNEEYSKKGYERAGRDVLKNVVDATGFAGLVGLAQKGRLTLTDEKKLETLKELYVKKLPFNRRDAFSQIWHELTSTESLQWYGRERLAYLLGVSSDDLMVIDNETVAIRQRGRRQQATITLGVDGRYAVRSGAEMRDVSNHEMQSLVRFLHRASI